MSTSSKRSGSQENGTISDGKHKTLRFNGVYEAPIDNLGWPGRLVRHKLLDATLSGTSFLVSIQKFRKPWLDTLMHILSFMGTEDFYTGIIVLLIWIVDIRFARLFTVLMGTAFYFTTASKNILRMPRPPNPPVAVLEKTYDWSLPSLHAVIGITLPGYLFFYPYRNYDLTSQGIIVLAVLIIAWTTCVCASRLYLGVHSPADIVTGLLLGSVLLSAYLQIDDCLDKHLRTSQYVSLQALVFYTLVLALHPQSGPPTHSFGETAVTCGVAYGMIVGLERSQGADEWYFAALLEQNSAKSLSGAQILALGCGRVLLGFPMVLLVRVVFKPLCRRAVFVLCHWLGVPCYSYAIFSRNYIQLNKHYTSGYKLPPIHKKEKDDKEDSNDHHVQNGGEHLAGGDNQDVNSHSRKPRAEMGSWPWPINGKGSEVTLPMDVDNPTKFFVYSLMSWTAIEALTVVFFHTGLVAHTS